MQDTAANTYIVLAFIPMDVMPSPWLCVTVFKLPGSVKKPKPLRDAVVMGIMRWTLYNRLKEIYEPQGIKVKLTYGYITKHTRIENVWRKNPIAWTLYVLQGIQRQNAVRNGSCKRRSAAITGSCIKQPSRKAESGRKTNFLRW